jgi:putative membrane protein
MNFTKPIRIPLAVALLATTAYAHSGDTPLEPHELWTAWTLDPLIIFSLLLSAFVYVRGLLVMRREGALHSITRWQIASFIAGWLALIIALLSPLHRLGSALFSAHMTQHEVLMLVAAPLLVLGRPLIAFLWAFSPAARSRIGAFTKSAPFSTLWRAATAPVLVWLLHGFTLWIWHLPVLYQATLRSDLVHALQHVSFLGTALLFWWTLVHGRYGHMGYGAAVVYVFTTAVHSSILGALLTFARTVWYPIYDGRTAPFGLTALEDQQLGGLIMWVPSGTVFVVIGLALFAAWIGESERRVAYTQSESLLRSPHHAQNRQAPGTPITGGVK